MGKTGNITWKNHYFVQKMPNTEGMGICLGLELMLYFLTCNRVPKMNTILSSNRNGITRAQFQDKNG